MSGKLTELFRDLIELPYSEFRKMELDHTISNRGDILLRLARATRQKKGGLRALQEVLNRLDGKVAAEIEVEYPKFYFLFPNATSVEAGDAPTPQQSASTEMGLEKPEDDEPPTGSLRAIVDKLLDRPKAERLLIIAAADEIDATGRSDKGDPKLKSVMAASLFDMTQYNMGAIYELLDQIDGKVADKIKLLGNDVYITRYDEVAPRGAVQNENGVWQLEADNLTNQWAARLEQGRKK